MENTHINKQIDITVVVPVYNRLERLRLVVDSLLNQSFSGSYEIVIVDDGSSDETVSDLTDLDDKIRVIKQSNQGAAVARHTGVIHAQGGIIVFNDSDDIAYPYKLQVMFDALFQYPECVASIAVVENKFRADWQPPVWAAKMDGSLHVNSDPLSHFFNNSYPIAAAMNMAVRKDVAHYASKDSSFYKAANDFHFQLKVASKGSIVCAADITNEYYVGDGITAFHGTSTQEAYSLISLIENYIILKEPAEYLTAVQRRIENGSAKVLKPLLRKKKFGLFLLILKNMFIYGRVKKIPKMVWWAISA